MPETSDNDHATSATWIHVVSQFWLCPLYPTLFLLDLSLRNPSLVSTREGVKMASHLQLRSRKPRRGRRLLICRPHICWCVLLLIFLNSFRSFPIVFLFCTRGCHTSTSHAGTIWACRDSSRGCLIDLMSPKRHRLWCRHNTCTSEVPDVPMDLKLLLGVAGVPRPSLCRLRRWETICQWHSADGIGLTE